MVLPCRVESLSPFYFSSLTNLLLLLSTCGLAVCFPVVCFLLWPSLLMVVVVVVVVVVVFVTR